MRETQQKALAKLNLTLAITGRRADGYHEIRTILHRISLHDTVTIRLLDRTESARDESGAVGLTTSADLPGLPMGRENLVGKAAHALMERLKLPEFVAAVDVHIEKRIPVAAGLAGGSADAAAVLIGLNRLLDQPFDLHELAVMGAAIGADVPFCLYSQSGMDCALATGIGEVITPLPGLAGWAVLVAPDEQLTAAQVYGQFDRIGAGGGLPDEEQVRASLAAKDWFGVERGLGNALEPAARALSPEVERAHGLLAEAAAEAGVAMRTLMSGSGPAVFGLAPGRTAAEAVVARLRGEYENLFVVRLGA